MIKKHIHISILLLIFSSSYAQFGGNSLEKANMYFNNFSYDKAIEKYIESQDTTIATQRNLATSYLKLGNSSDAENVFAKIINREDKLPEDVYKYASILEQNKKYNEAHRWMNEFHELAPNDGRAKAHINESGYEQLLKDKQQFRLKTLDINSEQEDFGPTFYQNKVLFVSNRKGLSPVNRKWNGNNLPFLDIYQASQVGSASLDSIRVFRSKLNKKYHEGPVSFNSDETLMAFTRDNYDGESEDGTIHLKLYFSELKEGKWDKLTEFPYNSDDYSVGHASYSNDDKWLYFASDMPGGIGGVDLYKVEVKDSLKFGEPINLGSSINTEDNEMFPFVYKNEIIFYSSNGKAGLGGLDVFIAQIKPDGTIGKSSNLGVPINSNKDDLTFILDDSGKYGYFASNREESLGQDDIYAFDLLKPFTFNKIIKGTAKDTEGNILAGVEVNLYDSVGNIVATTVTTEDGSYSFEVEPGKEFKLTGAREQYTSGNNTASTKGEAYEVIADLTLSLGFSLYCQIVDHETQAPLDSVYVELTNKLTEQVEKFYTSNVGDFYRTLEGKKLNDQIIYHVKISREGYLAKSGDYNKKLTRSGQYNIHEELNMSLDKIEVGMDISKIIEINPIYFDLNSSIIRKDATVELDKIVNVMVENPEMVIELASHTDCRGTAKYNEWLSDKRAKSSAAYIRKHIPNPERIYGKGYGENQHVNECECEGAEVVPCTEEQHQENRRTEFTIVKM